MSRSKGHSPVAGSTAHRLSAATAQLDPPLAALDVAALQRNARELVRRAAGTPIRLASKSIRCRWVLDNVLAQQGFRGVMAYSLAEARWLAGHGVGDILLGYPTADRRELSLLAADPQLLAEVTLMIDDVRQLEFLAVHARPMTGGPPVATLRVCLDIDASLRIGPAHLGVRRSPLRTPRQAADLVTEARRRGSVEVVGVMFYEAQVAGLPDTSPAVALVKRRSVEDLNLRRAAVVAAVLGAGADLQFVNSGGTGSLESSSADPIVTEVTAGSGLYSPGLFDRYDNIDPDPALFFALPVVRRPAPDIATAFGGGYIASGPAKKSRQPSLLSSGLSLIPTEGAGEVQTPLKGRGARALAIGDRVWLRHAKAGELLERFNTVQLVEGSEVTGEVPSYRGDGQTFG
jgi:D-serine deaminase-like pyridoxal phosphate-dependent protein